MVVVVAGARIRLLESWMSRKVTDRLTELLEGAFASAVGPAAAALCAVWEATPPPSNTSGATTMLIPAAATIR